ncbi:SDR family NAD(P)-dependent oxidoreductase [Streptomyces hainanensis]|uniref:SDR family NAD(P)-dependent oxidoreductase n=1 Tax=Streptomyces hainanensis TaxID=402648 RepID=A0A4R4TDC6_9ACTN|nr:SDR family NAD(P)-dependent oxidoreductase [Streptomyces hainanensis]TDC75471.1 SDR family NAD(P)-dependent oxidoreductase [Streptomyces hainanensis]
MRLRGATALVTGASRDLGRHFAEELLRRGAAKVYATARRPELVDLPGAEVLALDVTEPASVAAAAAAAGDVDLLVNNAGVSLGVNLVDGDLDEIRLTLDTHVYGTLAMIRAFAPVLAENGGGAILNVLSVLSFQPYDGNNAYAVAKSAEWSLTNGVRLELADQGTLVTGLVFGPTATTTMRAFAERAALAGGALPDGVLNDPVDIVRTALDGVESGRTEILADHFATAAKSSLAGDPRAFVVETAGETA